MNSAYNQMPLDEQSRRLTQFVIGNQQYEFNRLFYGISIGPAAFSAFMSKIFRPLILKKNAITYLDDVSMQLQTKEEMFNVLEHYHKILQNENLKAAPDKSHFFLTRVKFLGHNIERKTITPLKSRIDAIQKLQPPTNKKKIQELLGMLNFLSKYVYKMQLYLRPFYIILRQLRMFEIENIFLPPTDKTTITTLKQYQNLDPVIRQLKSWHKYKTKIVKADTTILGNKTLENSTIQ